MQPEYVGYWIANFSGDITTTRPRSAFVQVGVGCYGGTAPATVELALPDLNAVPGWNPDWTFGGTQQGYVVFAYSSDLRNVTLDGATVRFASRSAFGGVVSTRDEGGRALQAWGQAMRTLLRARR